MIFNGQAEWGVVVVAALAAGTAWLGSAFQRRRSARTAGVCKDCESSELAFRTVASAEIRALAIFWCRVVSRACHDVAMAKEHVYRDGDRVEVRRPAIGDWIPGRVLGRKQVNGVTRYLIQLLHSAAAEARDPNNWYTTDRLRAA